MVEAAGLPRRSSSSARLGSKTRVLLSAEPPPAPRCATSPSTSRRGLAQAAIGLRDLRFVDVRPAVARYPEELDFLRRPAVGRRLVLFLGVQRRQLRSPRAVELLAADAASAGAVTDSRGRRPRKSQRCSCRPMTTTSA